MPNSFILLFLFVISISAQQKDPLKDFCRLFGHSTAVVDRKLYIDGGFVNWGPISPTSLNYSSGWLRNGNLDEDNEGFPKHYTLNKNATVPSLHGGVLWPDASNKVLYQYGGEYTNGKPEDFALWYYDIVYDTWNISNVSVTNINRASWGAGAVVQDKGRGYYYGGWLTQASVPGQNGSTVLNNMLVFDMIANKFRNETGPDSIPRAEGVMVYLPVGDGGVMIYFGGIQLPYQNSTVIGVPMSEIHIYDIGSSKWYTQNATGEVPEQRRRFCAGATWVQDRSSYNIYLYGGASIDQGVGFGDVYILSLPSFTWIKYWPRKEDNIGNTFPHHSLSCDVIDYGQMIIMGGSFPNSSECDAVDVYGQHGLSLGKENKNNAKWALFEPSLKTYRIPPDITQVIGGAATGGATVLAPTSGFKDRDVKVQFERPYTPTSRTATRYIPPATPIPTTTSPTPTPTPTPAHSNNKNLIAGAVGGGIGGFLLVACFAGCVLWRRRRRARKSSTQRPPVSEARFQHIPRHDPRSPELDSHPGKSIPASPAPQYGYSPRDSTRSPSDRTWSTSQYGHTSVPEYPGSLNGQGHGTFAAPSPMHMPYDHGHQRSHSAQTHEMPIVRSPEPVNPQFGVPREVPHMTPSPVQQIEPYFAQHPPRGN